MIVLGGSVRHVQLYSLGDFKLGVVPTQEFVKKNACLLDKAKPSTLHWFSEKETELQPRLSQCPPISKFLK